MSTRLIRASRSESECFFKELGMAAGEEDLDDYQLFRYLHQTHNGAVGRGKLMGDKGDRSVFMAVEKYNDTRYLDFLAYPLSAQMTFFLYNNFIEQYTPLLKEGVKDRTLEILGDIIA